MKEKAEKPIAIMLSSVLIAFVLFTIPCGKGAARREVIRTKTGIEIVSIPAGWFEMGSDRGKADEAPVHRVWIDAFLMDRHEVTQENYGKLVLGNPSHFKGPANPMEQMRWSDAALYCNARSRAEGLEPCYDEETGDCNFQANGYRLPTEAEWEYACRAGTSTDYFFGREGRVLKEYAWYGENSSERTHPVGQKKPNPYGLYDMYGNVAEWCSDRYDENYYKNSPEKNPIGPAQGKKYVLRGGAWSSSADICRSSYRVGEDPGFQDACFARDNIGFRCVRKSPQSMSMRDPAFDALKSPQPPLLKGEFRVSPLLKGGFRASLKRFKGGQFLGVTLGDLKYHKPPACFSAQVILSMKQAGSLWYSRGGAPSTLLLKLFPKACKNCPPLNLKRGIGGFSNVGFNQVLIQNPASSIQNQGSKATGFIYHDIYLQHKTGANHPERPQRLEAIVTRLKEKGILSKLTTPEPSPASIEWITAIHTPQYIEHVRKGCQDGIEYMDSADTPVSPESYKVALAAVGGVLAAIDKVMAGEIRNAFCAVRPPGHHALADRAMGFCIFNNVAIGARYTQKKYGLSRVLIVDWDVHHGNGTQAAFYDDPTVLYFSAHQSPFYPGTGNEQERGTGKGLGYTINVPLQAGSGDEEYIKAFEQKLKPEAIKFNPEFILVSAGFDAHKDDLIGGMNVTSKGFAEMTAIVKDIAEKCCKGRLVSVLEGGYSLDGLADSVEAHISVLLR